MSYVRFGSFTLDTRKRLLQNGCEAIELGPKVIETLIVLVENAGALVTKAELMERLWPNQFVQEANLTQNVYRLRKALARGGLSDAIETMPWRGYRFVASIETCTGPPNGHPKTMPLVEMTLTAQVRWIAGVAALLFLLSPFPPPSASAYSALSRESQRLYALGRYHWNLRFDRSQIKTSLRYFRSVIKRDPANPLGYAGLADAYLTVVDSYCSVTRANCRGAVQLAVANARRAVEVGPYSAEAHTSYAMTLFTLLRNYAESDAQFRSAIALNDGYALAHYWYGNTLLARGKRAEAAAQYKRALEFEPASPGVYAWLAADEYYSGHFRLAVQYARESLAITPRWPLAWIVLGLAHRRLGEFGAATVAFEHLPEGTRSKLAGEPYVPKSGRR